MKKILTLFYISLIIGLIFAVTGGIIIDREQVNMGQIYNILQENLNFSEKKVVFEKTEVPEISEIENYTTDKTVGYPLNEFHTLEIFAENCTVELKPTEQDEMKISLDYSDKLTNKLFLRTAVKNGSLRVLTTWTDSSVNGGNALLTIEIPDNYKGGYSVSGSGTTVSICDLESSMDFAFNLLDSTVTVGTLEGGEFTFEMSGTSLTAENVSSRGGVSFSAASSTLNVNTLNSAYTKLAAGTSTVNLKNISGGITADTQTTTLNCEFKRVGGNVSVAAETGSIGIKIPHDSPVSLRHDESYSVFKDNVVWTGEGTKNKDFKYIIDTKVKFSIVTLDEK
ncbi:MAG: hypothetical protein II931_03610 [Clostridia bacterium]|nr:hypothetical protein [Clostridia bacterium]